MKRFISLMLLVFTGISVMTGAMFAHAEGVLPFSDVKQGDWYYEDVQTAYEHGIVNGKDSNVFDPDAPMKRAELVAVLSRLADGKVADKGEEAADAYSDINGIEWYADYVGWASSAGLVNGYGDGTFRAEEPIIRQELAAMLDRFLTYMFLEIRDDNSVGEFADTEDIPSWAAANVDVLRSAGLIRGDQEGKFNPQSAATRAEIAAIVSRIIVYLDNAEDIQVSEHEFDIDNMDQSLATELKIAYCRLLNKNYFGEKFKLTDVWVDANLGDYSDCAIFCMGAPVACTDEPQTVYAAGYRIVFPSDRFIYVYKDEEIYTLKEAYDHYLISRSDVYEIASIVDADNRKFTDRYLAPKVPGAFPYEIELEIMEMGPISIGEYLGNYSGCEILYVNEDGCGYVAAVTPRDIAGYTIYFSSGWIPSVYKDGRFHSLTSAGGLITKSDVYELGALLNGRDFTNRYLAPEIGK